MEANGVRAFGLIKRPALASLILLSTPALCQAEQLPLLDRVGEAIGLTPFQVGMILFSTVYALLWIASVVAYLYRAKLKRAKRKCAEMTAELAATQDGLNQTTLTLENTDGALKAAEFRHQSLLNDAAAGIFQMDAAGNCTYINAKLEELCGLPPKKAYQKGLMNAIHEEDRERVNKDWKAFVDDGQAFSPMFRYQHSDGRVVTVVCQAHKVESVDHTFEGYTGLVTDVTELDIERKELETAQNRYRHFVEQTTQGFYQLSPAEPIPLDLPKDEIAKSIHGTMSVAACNKAFARMSGTSVEKLKGAKLDELTGGCGSFETIEAVRSFVDYGYKSVDKDTVRMDPKGNRLNLLNNAVGIIENGCLTAIWGTQRDISRETQEREELIARNEFMQRVLASLPGDVEVKDTRCRFLFVSDGVAEKTGVPADKWIGKTIFEIMPSTPRDHNKLCVEVMKNGKSSRGIEPYETTNGPGWLESIEIPLVSNDGLVEGTVGLSMDVTERCRTEEELRCYRAQLEETLEKRSRELEKEIDGHRETEGSLRESSKAQEQLKLELKTRLHEFKVKIDEHKTTEKQLRESEASLGSRKAELEELVARQTLELEKEMDKRSKWEELLEIKEEELNRLSGEIEQQKLLLGEENTRREVAEAKLLENQTQLDSIRKELEGIDAKYDKKLQSEIEKRNKLETAIKEREDELIKLGELIEQRNQYLEDESGQREQTEDILKESREELEAARKKLDGIATKHAQQLEAETGRRHKIEGQLRKNEDALQQAHARLKELAGKHSNELRRETEARKIAENLLRETKEALSDHNQNMQVTVEDQTRTLKREIAERQIREKALRLNDAELKRRLKELEKALGQQTKELEKQIAAGEAVEAERQKMKNELETLKAAHNVALAQQAQELNVEISDAKHKAAELQKREEELMQKQKDLEALIKQRTQELEKQVAAGETVEAERQKMKDELEILKAEHKAAIVQQAQELNVEISDAKQKEAKLRKREEELLQKQKDLEALIKQRTQQLEAETDGHKKAETDLRESQKELARLRKQQQVLIAQETKTLTKEINARKKAEEQMQKREQDLRRKGQELEKLIRQRAQDLEGEVRKRKESENSLKKLQKEFNACHNDIDGLLKMRTQEFEREISNQKKAEEELRLNETRLSERIVELEERIEQRIREVEKADQDREKTELALIEYVDKYNQYGSEMEEKMLELTNTHKEAMETRQQAERMLQQSERQYRTLFESSADAFMIIDPETGEIFKANPAAAQLFNLENPDRLQNKTLGALSPDTQPDDSPSTELAIKHIQRAARKGTDVFEWLYSKSDRTPLYALTSLSAVETEDRPQILAVIRDITAIQNRQTELLKAKDDAEAASRTSSSFVNEINDALQSSLNPILNGSAAIKDAPNLSEPQRQQVLDINRSAHNLKEMINYRMELIRIADGTSKVESCQFDLHRLIQGLDEEFSSAAESKRLFFATSHAHNVPQHIVADGEKVHQVLSGMLGYAVDHTVKGRLGLHATKQESSADQHKIAFEVAYTGSAEEDPVLSRVFGSDESRLPNDTAASEIEYSLAISRQYARIMGGDITLENRTGNITLLRFEIICGKVAAPAQPAKKEAELAVAS